MQAFQSILYPLVALFIAVGQAQATTTQIQPDSVMIPLVDLIDSARHLQTASDLFIEQGDCKSRRCGNALKAFAKEFARILNKHEIDTQEGAQQSLALVLNVGHQLNQESPKSEVRGLFTDESKFRDFQKDITNAINKRQYRLWQKALLVIGGIAVVVLTAGIGFYIGGLLMYGLTWQILVSGAIGASLLGGSTYYLVARPMNQNYSRSHVDKQVIGDIEAYLNGLEISDSAELEVPAQN